MCMYQHGMKVSDEEVIGIVSEVEDAVEDQKCEEQGNTNNENDATFMNPSQSDSSKIDAEPFHCDICDKNFATKQSLTEHKLKTHNWCQLCNSTFDSKKKYKGHYYSAHTYNPFV